MDHSHHPRNPLIPPFMPRSGPARRGWLASLPLVAAPFLLGADDSYLREIEAEVKRQATTLITVQARPESAATATMDAAADRLASGLDQAAFEQALRETLPGTYALYQQFDPEHKQQVYQTYRNDNRLAGISERVIQLLGAKP